MEILGPAGNCFEQPSESGGATFPTGQVSRSQTAPRRAKPSAGTKGELVITALKPQLHDENRVNVFINHQYDFSLDLAQVVDFGVKPGRNLSPKELSELRSASEFGKLYERTLAWVLLRPRSVRETRDYLRHIKAKRSRENQLRLEERLGPREDSSLDAGRQTRGAPLSHRTSPSKPLPEISSEMIDNVLSRLIERKYLSDANFARYYIENRFTKKGISRRRLELELQNKGISKEDIELAFADCPRDDSAEIRKIISRKANKYPPEKLIQYLTRQGFDYQLVRNLVLETDSQNSE